MFRGLGKKLYSWACGQDYFSGQAYAYNYKLHENKKRLTLFASLILYQAPPAGLEPATL
jgi:hypothetical protein